MSKTTTSKAAPKAVKAAKAAKAARAAKVIAGTDCGAVGEAFRSASASKGKAAKLQGDAAGHFLRGYAEAAVIAHALGLGASKLAGVQAISGQFESDLAAQKGISERLARQIKTVARTLAGYRKSKDSESLVNVLHDFCAGDGWSVDSILSVFEDQGITTRSKLLSAIAEKAPLSAIERLAISVAKLDEDDRANFEKLLVKADKAQAEKLAKAAKEEAAAVEAAAKKAAEADIARDQALDSTVVRIGKAS